MSADRLADQDARDLAVEQFDRPLVLEAGAGTGKTRALVARLATWLLGSGWEAATADVEAARERGRRVHDDDEAIATATAEAVVAITFTDAAAAEMASRLGRLLAQLAAGGSAEDLEPRPALLVPLPVATRARALAATLGRLRIQTIHAFCHRLLAEHPFEAGLHPEPALDPDGELLARAATETLRSRLRQRTRPIVELIAEGVDPVDLLEALRTLCAQGIEPADLAQERFSPEVALSRLDRLAAAAALILPRLRQLEGEIGRRMSTLRDALAALEAIVDRAGSGPEGAVERLQEVADLLREELPTVAKVLGRWRRGELTPTEAAALAGAPDKLFDDAERLAAVLDEISVLDPARFEVVRRALLPLVEETRGRLRRDGVLGFDDLLLRAVDLLERDRGLRRRLRRGIRQLLVDEFQDTDARQCRLIELLVLEDEEAGPGLFLVGDPKQSIYAFRSADLASYQSLIERLERAGGVRRALEVNFRSDPPILDEVERAVAPAMREERGVQPPFVPLRVGPSRSAGRGFERAGRRPVELWMSGAADGARRTAGESAELEAAAIAADLRDLHDRERLPWSSFALLLRSRGDLEIYLDALRRAAVPFEVQKDRSYFQRREIVDLACAVRAILDPADQLALVAFLRSPLVGVPDAAWLPLWGFGLGSALAELEDGDPEALAALDRLVAAAAERTPAAAPGCERLDGWPDALRAAFRAIADLRSGFRRLSAPEWIERLRLWLLPEPVAAARYLGRFGLANVERLLGDLEIALADATDPGRALAALRSALDERREAEEARPPESGHEAVSVMTIHAAKGLEFDQVYLPQLHKRPRADVAVPAHELLPPSAGDRNAERELVLLGAPSPGWWAAAERRRAAREAEAVRLLYVAMTRARERIVLCGSWPAPERSRSSAASFLELLAPRWPAEVAEAPGTGDVVDRFGALWRRTLPTPAPPPAWESGGRETSAAAEPVERIRARRATARARQVRPLIAAATAATHLEAADPLTRPGADPAGAARARALGIAVHRALERISPDSLEAGAPAEPETAGLRELLDGFRHGELGRRFRQIAKHVAARELPLLVAADPAAADGSLCARVGQLDLLYRDPSDGRWVVADFKSDDVADAAAVAARAASYAPQLRIYGQAVRAGLGLDRPPRLELWFLSAGRIVVVPESADGDAESG